MCYTSLIDNLRLFALHQTYANKLNSQPCSNFHHVTWPATLYFSIGTALSCAALALDRQQVTGTNILFMSLQYL